MIWFVQSSSIKCQALALQYTYIGIGRTKYEETLEKYNKRYLLN